MLSDLDHTWGGDLTTSPGGDIQTVDGLNRTQQRVIRRLLTAPGDYIWQLGYGAGLGKFVGKPVSVSNIEAVIRSQLRLEPSVSQLPVPEIEVTNNGDGNVFVVIKYTNSDTGETDLLSVPLG